MRRVRIFALAAVCCVLWCNFCQAEIPEHVRACVRVSGCGGVVVSRGPQWSRVITARHCYGGKKLNDKFTATFVDGSSTQATLLTTHHSYDLAMLAVPSHAVLGVCKLATGRPDRARYEAIGWPQRCSNGVCSQQLTYFLLSPHAKPIQQIHGEKGQYDGAPDRFAFVVDQGGNTPGASGMPIFANGQFIGVNCNNNGHKVGTISYAAMPEQVAEFIRIADERSGTDKWNLGDWSEPAVMFEDAPPALAYGPAASNRPLNLTQFGAPQVPQSPLPPAPDAGHGGGQQHHPETHDSNSEIYSGKGKKPDDLNNTKKRTHVIDEIRHEQAELQAAVETLKGAVAAIQAGAAKGEQGPPGEPGKDGRDGQDFVPPKSKGHPVLGFALAGLTIVVVGGAAFLRGVRKAEAE